MRKHRRNEVCEHVQRLESATNPTKKKTGGVQRKGVGILAAATKQVSSLQSKSNQITACGNSSGSRGQISASTYFVILSWGFVVQLFKGLLLSRVQPSYCFQDSFIHIGKKKKKFTLRIYKALKTTAALSVCIEAMRSGNSVRSELEGCVKLTSIKNIKEKSE